MGSGTRRGILVITLSCRDCRFLQAFHGEGSCVEGGLVDGDDSLVIDFGLMGLGGARYISLASFNAVLLFTSILFPWVLSPF